MVEKCTEADRARTYAELEWIRYYEWKGKQWQTRTRQRQPGWAARTYREMFGMWPEEWMLGLTPQEPCDLLRKLVTKRDNAFKRERKREREAGGPVSSSSSSSKRNTRSPKPGNGSA